MVRRKLTQSEQKQVDKMVKDIKRIQNKMMKAGYDVAEGLQFKEAKTVKQMETLKDVWLHATKSTKYKLVTFKDDKGREFKATRDLKVKAQSEIKRQSKQPDIKVTRKGNKRFFENKHGVKISEADAIRNLVAINIQNMKNLKEDEMKTKNKAYVEARKGLSNLQISMGKGGGELKGSRSFNISNLQKEQNKAISNNASKLGNAKELDDKMRERKKEILIRLETFYGKETKEYKDIEKMHYEDVYALQDINGETFWKSIHYPEKDVVTQEDNDSGIGSSNDSLRKQIDEYKITTEGEKKVFRALAKYK